MTPFEAGNARKVARESGAIKYDGQPCKDCGGTIRYVKNAACVACVNSRKYINKHCVHPDNISAATRKASDLGVTIDTALMHQILCAAFGVPYASH